MEEVSRVFEEMKLYGFLFDGFIYSIFFDGYFRCGNVDSMLVLLDEVIVKGI